MYDSVAVTAANFLERKILVSELTSVVKEVNLLQDSALRDDPIVLRDLRERPSLDITGDL